MWSRGKAGGWRLLGALMMMGGAGTLAWSIFGRVPPRPENISQRIGARGGSFPASAPSGTIPPVEQFAHIWNKDIRQPLDGAAPAIFDAALSTETMSSAPVSNMKLMATAVDAQRPCAIFSSDSQSDPLVCTIGQIVDGMKIVSIESQKVTVEYQGKRFNLTVPDRYDSVAAPGASVEDAIPPPEVNTPAVNAAPASKPAIVPEAPHPPSATPNAQ
jgi:hypothetical protein